MVTVDLHHKIYGSGPPLVILHGLFGCLDNWHTLATRWSNHRQVISVDLRNHGRSPHHDEFGYAEMAADVAALIGHEGPIDLIGHSMGGKAAMTLALSRPDLINKLVVVDISPRPYDGGLLPIFEALENVDFTGITDRKSIDEQLATQINSVGVRMFLMKNLTRTDNGGFRWKMNLPVIRRAYDHIDNELPINGNFGGPVLAVRGTQSGYITEADREIFGHFFENFNLTDINCGHWVHAEAPGKFFEVVDRFLG